jgi:hypothetical protein
MFVARADAPASRPLDLPDGDVLAISRSGEMLLSLGRRYLSPWTPDGTLARGRLFDSSVREVLEHVRYADFLAGDRLAVVRRVDGRDRLEVPQGNVVFETPGYISHIRVAPDGRRVAFLEHPLYGDNRGYVALYDGTSVRRLTPEYSGVEAVVWSANGRELWYGAAVRETHWPIKAIDADATEPRDGRTVWYVPRDLLIHDIDSHGRVLLSGNEAGGLTAGATGDAPVRRFALGRWTVPAHVSADGRTVLASSLDAGDPNYNVVLASMDGSPPVKIGIGRAQEISPDGKWALAITPSQPQQVMLFPTGPGEPRELDVGDLTPNVAAFVPSALTVAVIGAREGSAAAVIVDVTSGERHTIDLPELRGRAFSLRRYLPARASPDGKLLAIQADDGKVLAWTLPNGGPARELGTLRENEAFAGWSADSNQIFVAAWNGPKARIEALDIGNGRRTMIREIAVEDPAGMLAVPELYLSADARAYVYGFSRVLSTLYVVTGLR